MLTFNPSPVGVVLDPPACCWTLLLWLLTVKFRGRCGSKLGCRSSQTCLNLCADINCTSWRRGRLFGLDLFIAYWLIRPHQFSKLEEDKINVSHSCRMMSLALFCGFNITQATVIVFFLLAGTFYSSYPSHPTRG